MSIGQPLPGAWFDDAIRWAAAQTALIDIHQVPGKKPERALVEAFRDGLASTTRFPNFRLEQPCELLNWSSPPGGIDLVANLDAGRRLDFEMKVDKPDETIWDAIKLADVAAGRGSGVSSSYLVLWATTRSWVVGEASALFDMPRTWGVKEMIETWPKAWDRLRRGGRGKVPRLTVAEIGVEPVADVKANSDQYDASIRVVRVWPSTVVRLPFDSEGWPAEMEILDSATPMAEITDERPRRPRGAEDPCHDYLWLDRWTQRDIESVVPTLDESSRNCLRARLMTERNWSDAELTERFDPATAGSDGDQHRAAARSAQSGDPDGGPA